LLTRNQGAEDFAMSSVREPHKSPLVRLTTLRNIPLVRRAEAALSPLLARFGGTPMQSYNEVALAVAYYLQAASWELEPNSPSRPAFHRNAV
jgi:hypothetical protein